MRDALELTARRAPKTFVEGWTDRVMVAQDLLPIWNSFCEFANWGEPPDVIPWVTTKFWREDKAGHALIVDVFLALLRERQSLTKPAPNEDSASG